MNLGKGCNSVHHPHGQRPPCRGSQSLQPQAGDHRVPGVVWAGWAPKACMPSTPAPVPLPGQEVQHPTPSRGQCQGRALTPLFIFLLIDQKGRGSERRGTLDMAGSKSPPELCCSPPAPWEHQTGASLVGTGVTRVGEPALRLVPAGEPPLCSLSIGEASPLFINRPREAEGCAQDHTAARTSSPQAPGGAWPARPLPGIFSPRTELPSLKRPLL